MSESPTRLNADGEIEKRCGKCGEWWPATGKFFLRRRGKIASPCLVCWRELKYSPLIKPRKWTLEKVLEMYADYQQPMTLEQVGAKHKIGYRYLCFLFQRCQLLCRDHSTNGKLFSGRLKEHSHDEVALMYADYQQGVSCVVIAEDHHLSSHKSVRYLFKREGFSMRSASESNALRRKQLKQNGYQHPWKIDDERMLIR